MGWIFLILVVVLIGIFLVFRNSQMGKFPWIQFYLKGKESGFVFKEIKLLSKVAIESRLKDPTSLFWSIKQLDNSIKGIVSKYRAQGEENSEAANDFVSKLYNFRKRVEFQLPKYKLGLKTTREIASRQRVKITTPGMGPFFSIVVESLRKYVAFSYPQGPKLPTGFSWKGQQVSVYFWRTGDAGYFFSSKVLEDFSDKKYPIIHIAHTNNLIRTQKRRSVRVEINRSAVLFPLKNINEGNEMIEGGKGLRCKIVDVSEDGAAILIGGRAKVGLPIKLQFELNDNMIVLNGVVRGINFDEKRNRSILHLQAFTPSNRMRNRILTYVYNIFGEREDDEKKRIKDMKARVEATGDIV